MKNEAKINQVVELTKELKLNNAAVVALVKKLMGTYELSVDMIYPELFKQLTAIEKKTSDVKLLVDDLQKKAKTVQREDSSIRIIWNKDNPQKADGICFTEGKILNLDQFFCHNRELVYKFVTQQPGAYYRWRMMTREEASIIRKNRKEINALLTQVGGYCMNIGTYILADNSVQTGTVRLVADI